MSHTVQSWNMFFKRKLDDRQVRFQVIRNYLNGHAEQKKVLAWWNTNAKNNTNDQRNLILLENYPRSWSTVLNFEIISGSEAIPKISALSNLKSEIIPEVVPEVVPEVIPEVIPESIQEAVTEIIPDNNATDPEVI